MLTFHQFLILEELSDVFLRPVSVEKDQGEHEWHVHHPRYGHLATVSLRALRTHPEDHEAPSMHKATKASMKITSKKNPSVPKHEILRHTNKGPQYNLGAAGTRKLLHKIALEYPRLKTIGGERVTGIRGRDDDNNSHPDARLPLDRIRKSYSKQQELPFMKRWRKKGR